MAGAVGWVLRAAKRAGPLPGIGARTSTPRRILELCLGWAVLFGPGPRKSLGPVDYNPQRPTPSSTTPEIPFGAID